MAAACADRCGAIIERVGKAVGVDRRVYAPEGNIALTGVAHAEQYPFAGVFRQLLKQMEGAERLPDPAAGGPADLGDGPACIADQYGAAALPYAFEAHVVIDATIREYSLFGERRTVKVGAVGEFDLVVAKGDANWREERREGG